VHFNGDNDKLRGQRDRFELVLKNSGLENYSWHCNRHTYASRLVMAGVDLRTVGELLGQDAEHDVVLLALGTLAPAAGG
jgi:site-specific recombinase XerD